jgi:hypothetical protein
MALSGVLKTLNQISSIMEIKFKNQKPRINGVQRQQIKHLLGFGILRKIQNLNYIITTV